MNLADVLRIQLLTSGVHEKRWTKNSSGQKISIANYLQLEKSKN